MKKIFSQIPLKLKLIISGTIPILVLLYFSYAILREKKDQIETTKNFITRLNISTEINYILSEIQQERRSSLSKLVYKGSEEMLNIQRNKVDEAAKDLQQALGLEFDKNYKDYTFLAQLPSWRRKIDRYEISVDEVLKNYQMLIDRLRSKEYIWTDNPTIPKGVGNALQVNTVLSSMVNYISLMRLRIYFISFDNGQANQDKFNLEFPILYKLFKSYEQELLVKGDTSSVEKYKTISKEGELRLTLAYFDQIFMDHSTVSQFS